MSSLFNATESLKHTTSLPDGASAAKAVELLQGHVFFIRFNPHMIKYEAIDRPTDPEPQLPTDRGLTGIAAPKCYQVTDRVHALPAGLWDSDVVSTYEFINLDKGVFVRIRSPLNTVLETVWTVQGKEGGGYELTEDVVMKCSRLLVGVIRNTCEGTWRAIHEKMVAEIRKES
ncbi:uncharacterized protein MAM_05766 [Metarhizium album ARSEF 1941]|uniref:DUF7053 domain-containing protein n=1 Tax=Metarhizium album (strain ARSEF 1941) TaxID=1081103 RepID=A0A0B2WSL6_METAS|nr:uncharacterized protein MAM_05766 [Metarhizium album ARSEF 1941]KHN96477.1 hypothetical protein MAM_05766 [Metarhizium album ARSEF 1941]